MRKIFIGLGIFILLLKSAFTAVDIGIGLSSDEIDLNDSLTLSIELSSDDADNYTITDIAGVDSFDIIGQYKSSSYSSINGKTSIITSITLELKPKDKGEYSIGPVKAIINGEEKLYGDEQTVKVTGDKLFVGNVSDLKLDKLDTSENETKKEVKSEESNEFKVEQEDKIKDEATERVLGFDGEEMKDIYDIKGNILSSPINLIWSLFYIVFFVLVYFLYKAYLNTKNKFVGEETEFVKEEINYLEKLDNLDKYIDGTKEIFYSKILEVVRLYLDNEVKSKLSSKTLKEIKGEVSAELFNLIEKLYYPEYDNKEDIKENRVELISKAKELLTKK